MEKIKLCYVDDDPDIYLSLFLGELNDFDYSDIIAESDDTFDTLIDKITQSKCQVVILDSKLYKESTVQTKITGQELELLLAERLPYLFSIVISQNEDLEGLNYIRKYPSHKSADSFSESREYYNQQLSKLLEFGKNKIIRCKNCYEKELLFESTVDKLKLENIESLLEGNNKNDLTRSDIDQIISILEELVDNGDK